MDKEEKIKYSKKVDRLISLLNSLDVPEHWTVEKVKEHMYYGEYLHKHQRD